MWRKKKFKTEISSFLSIFWMVSQVSPVNGLFLVFCINWLLSYSIENAKNIPHIYKRVYKKWMSNKICAVQDIYSVLLIKYQQKYLYKNKKKNLHRARINQVCRDWQIIFLYSIYCSISLTNFYKYLCICG